MERFTGDTPFAYGGLSNAEHQARWRQRHKVQKGSTLPFVGCDGEGSGVDELGRQLYMLFRMGNRELFTGSPLGTKELLEFIASAPAAGIYVGFSFGYDVTMILRDLSEGRRARLLSRPERGEGKSPYTYWGNYAIEYLPKNYLRVARTKEIASGKTAIVPGSSRTIWETFGFFQSSFLKALKNFDVGLEHLPFIEASKDARSVFDATTDETRRYCAIECDLLAEMMEKLRDNCTKVNITPHTWSGAGKLATSLHDQHRTTKKKDVDDATPFQVLTMARQAYYGGRFEITRTGAVAGPVFEYDINSAYPDAMRDLPCLIHGRWRQLVPGEVPGQSTLYVARVSFDHPNRPPLCGLPIRNRNGHIFWPYQGNGVYWSCELDAAAKLGCEFEVKGGFAYQRCCDCHHFDWVEPLYDYRKSLGKSGQGYPIKLGINSLYGKLAQRVGTPKYGNPVWAGLITARTRAKLMEAVSHDPDSVLMLATDAVYAKNDLFMPVGSNLGYWELAKHARMFIVQPGLYWGPPKPKTRGIPPKFFETHTVEFEAAWQNYVEAAKAAQRPWDLGFPECSIPLTSFIGLKLAQARNKPQTAGQWVTQDRTIKFDWTRKRRLDHGWDGDAALTYPIAGSPDLESLYYTDVTAEVHTLWDGSREELDDQPDYVDLGIPFKD